MEEIGLWKELCAVLDINCSLQIFSNGLSGFFLTHSSAVGILFL